MLFNIQTMNFNYESQIKAHQYNWIFFENAAMRFSVKNGQLLKHRITVLCTEGANCYGTGKAGRCLKSYVH